MDDVHDGPRTPHRWKFWILFASICSCTFLTGLDVASIGTALPAITHDLHSGATSFAWVSSSYTLAATAILPLVGRVADIFGRRTVLVFSLAFFMAGSAVCGAAWSMEMMITGRALQGVGAGGIQASSLIIVADLTPLRQRGLFTSINNLMQTFASISAAPLAGLLVEKATWRWLFYLNVPLCAVSTLAVLLFLNLKKPSIEGSIWKNLSELDFVGNLMIIGSTASCIIALTWAGVKYPWISYQVLVPLCIGIVGLCAALVYEKMFASSPSVPVELLTNRTSFAGYLGSFIHFMVIIATAFYLPTYFQAAQMASPLRAGLYMLPICLSVDPAVILQGVLISKFGKYLPVIFIGWATLLIGTGLFTLMSPSTPIAVTIPFQMIIGVGLGLLFANQNPVQAPHPESSNAAALSLLTFVRNFAQSWGISIGASILQNELQQRLPSSLLATIPQGEDYAYNLIPQIPNFESTLQSEVRLAFAESLQVVWRVLLIFSAVGMASMALMKAIPLSTTTSRERGIESSSSSSEGHEQGPEMAERQLEGGGEQGEGFILDAPKPPWSRDDSSTQRPSTGNSQRTMVSQATAVTTASTPEEGKGGEGGHLYVPGKAPGKCKMKRPSTSWSTTTMVAIDDAKSRAETKENDMTEKIHA